MHLQLGDITAIPVSSEQMQKGQSQLVKKASCFFLFYFWNLFHQKLGNAYDMAFSINSIMIPALQNYAFTQLGITLKNKEDPAVEHYFDALQFGEETSGKDKAEIYLAIKDALNGLGIPELAISPSQDYDETRFRIYKDTLLQYFPAGDETRVTVPEGIKIIRSSAFRGLQGITTLDLPDSLEELKTCALGFMPDLIEVNLSHDLRYAGDFITMESKIEKELDGMLVIGGWLIKCNVEDEVIRIPENVVGICCDAFDDAAKSAKEIILPSGLKEIKEETFNDFSELEKINLPEGLQCIGAAAFSDCVSLKELVIPETVDTIENGAFQGCESLERVRISEAVTEIGECTFVDCHALRELHLPESLRTIGADGINAFAGCSSLQKIVFPEHLEYIGECAFQDCEALEEIVLPESVQKIGAMAFAGCEKLKTVHLPQREIEIGENAFEGTLWEKDN